MGLVIFLATRPTANEIYSHTNHSYHKEAYSDVVMLHREDKTTDFTRETVIIYNHPNFIPSSELHRLSQSSSALQFLAVK